MIFSHSSPFRQVTGRYRNDPKSGVKEDGCELLYFEPIEQENFLNMAPNEPQVSKQESAETSWASIDRRDWQLWLLSFLLIIVLGVGVLSFMFPVAFWDRGGVLRAPDRAFYGFSLLLALTLAYLHQKESMLRDLKRKRWEEKLVHTAFHDALTDLPNRLLFLDRLGQCVSRAKRHAGYLFAILYMDLDRFKIINDSMGHVAGDQLLVQVGQRLHSCLRATDTVSRLGGDEFAILMDEIKHTAMCPEPSRGFEINSCCLSPWRGVRCSQVPASELR